LGNRRLEKGSGGSGNKENNTEVSSTGKYYPMLWWVLVINQTITVCGVGFCREVLMMVIDGRCRRWWSVCRREGFWEV